MKKFFFEEQISQLDLNIQLLFHYYKYWLLGTKVIKLKKKIIIRQIIKIIKIFSSQIYIYIQTKIINQLESGNFFYSFH